MKKKEVKIRSAVPIYGVALVWALCALILPMYRLGDLLLSVGLVIAAYFALTHFFPGRVEYVDVPEEPVTTGNEETDKLLREGADAVAEMLRLRSAIRNEALRGKLDKLADVTGKIFKDVLDDPGDFNQIRRFADLYLPETMKLLRAYERFERGSANTVGAGGNIAGTMGRIAGAMDSILDSYGRQYDALFRNQAIDIETDIAVLEALLKREGLSGKDFG